MSKLTLKPGKFYRAKNGATWCCYRVDTEKAAHCRADCICVENSQIEYFYLDGRYDTGGKREHCLVEELP